MKVLALDYGPARTGVAVSDPTGTLARPLEVVERAGSGAGLQRLVQLVREEEAERVVVGLPLTLSGDVGEQARETQAFLAELKAQVDVPVETYDERFTTKLAGPRGDDAHAAAILLMGYLEWLASKAAR
ncbi:MAG: Holliday junction resolvase RuvX [Gaiellaceae bacterium]